MIASDKLGRSSFGHPSSQEENQSRKQNVIGKRANFPIQPRELNQPCENRALNKVLHRVTG
jgi:hypothetical protein